MRCPTRKLECFANGVWSTCINELQRAVSIVVVDLTGKIAAQDNNAEGNGEIFDSKELEVRRQGYGL